jgi:hypothetical protein
MANELSCPNCSAAMPADARFCDSCGAALPQRCANCGEKLTPGEAFCTRCGAGAGTERAGPETVFPAGTPQTSVSTAPAWRKLAVPAGLVAVGGVFLVAGVVFLLAGGSDGDESRGFSTAVSSSGIFADSSGGAVDNEDEILGDEDDRPAVEPTARSTSPPTPEPTLSTAWRVVLEDGFDSDAALWPTGDFEEGSASRTRDVADGVYSLSLESEGGWLAPELIPVDVGSDFYVAVDALRQLGGPETVCGLMIAGAGSYPRVALLAADQDGRFRVYRLGEGGAQLEDLIDLTPSSAVRTGAFNSLAIISQGSRLAFYINDEEVGEVDDSQIGNVEQAGVVTGLWDVRGAATCQFDNFEVRTP